MWRAILVLQTILILCLCNISFAEDSGTGSISGKVTIKGNIPLSEGLIFIFNGATGAPPSFDRYWRVPDDVVNTDAEGKFKAVLSKGRYYLGAIQRKSSVEIGPLQDGDLFLPFYADGAPVLYEVIPGSDTNLGIISGAKPFNRSILKTGDGITAIEGIIADASGKPVESALVFAFTSSSMIGKPLFISEKTGKDGKYLLRLYEGGEYYLKTRNSYGGGTMKAGDISGNYGQDKPSAVSVKTGGITKGIDITAAAFSGQGQKSNKKK